jgi:hypothetical protein
MFSFAFAFVFDALFLSRHYDCASSLVIIRMVAGTSDFMGGTF